MKDYNWNWDFDPSYPVHFFEFTVKGNQDPMHWHRYYEIGLCTGGTGRFFYYSKQYPVNEGDVFVANNYESHVAVGESDVETHYIFMIMLPSFVNSNINPNLNRLYTDAFMYNPLEFNNCIPSSLPTAQKIAPLMHRGLEICNTHEEGWEIELDIIVRSILHQLWIHYRNPGTKPVLKLNAHVQAAQQYISNNYNRNLSVNEVAAQVGLNPSYFRHLFKSELHISFKEYVTRLRLSHARTLLMDTNYSIGHVVEEIGYTNIGQFYRVFHRYYDMTPAEYRRIATGTGNSEGSR